MPSQPVSLEDDVRSLYKGLSSFQWQVSSEHIYLVLITSK